MKSWKAALVPVILLILPVSLAAQTNQEYVQQGINAFGAGDYVDAVENFREVLLSSRDPSLLGDAYFWTAKSYLALGRYDDAGENLEYFIMNYPDNPNYPESLYQKGRLLLLQEEYEKSIQVFYSFLDNYPSTPFTANSYYWIGEALFNLGHLQDARKVFTFVLDTYPNSYKVEAAGYRVALIDQKLREEVHTRLIKISHEEYLKTVAEFQRRERSYEQALAEYQRRISALTNSDNSAEIDRLNLQIAEKDRELSTLRNQISELKSQLEIASRVTQPTTQTANEAKSDQGQGVTVTVSGTTTEAKLLALKARALDLRSWYLDYLATTLEGDSE